MSEGREGRALDRAELDDVMRRADQLYVRCGQALREIPFEQWAAILVDATELRDVADADPAWYRGIILADLHRQLFPRPDDEDDDP